MNERYYVMQSWLAVIRRAIALGEADAAYRLTRGYVRRLRELSWRVEGVAETRRGEGA